MPGPRIIDIAPPVKGVDRSKVVRAQDELTCPSAVNFLSYAAVAGTTIVKRRGSRKAFVSKAGLGDSPITGLVGAIRPYNLGVPADGTIEIVRDDFSTYPCPIAYAGNPHGSIGYDLRGNWVRFTKDNNAGVAVYTNGDTTTTVGGATVFCSRDYAGQPPCLNFVGFTANDEIAIAANYQGNNDMEVVVRGYRRATAAAAFLECHAIGPMVRGGGVGGANGDQAFVAYLAFDSVNSVRLRVDEINGSTITNVGQSDVLGLSGLAIISNNCKIRLIATPTGLVATLNWQDESLTAEVIVAANTDFATANRVGIYYRCVGTAPGPQGAANNIQRQVVEVTYGRKIPLPVVVVKELTGGSTFNGGDLHQVPAGWTTVAVTGGTYEAQDGGTTGYSSSSVQNFPTVERDDGYIRGAVSRFGGTGSADVAHIAFPSQWAVTPPSEDLDVQVRQRDTGASIDDSTLFMARLQNLPYVPTYPA